jgi:hypothetical protein
LPKLLAVIMTEISFMTSLPQTFVIMSACAWVTCPVARKSSRVFLRYSSPAATLLMRSSLASAFQVGSVS